MCDHLGRDATGSLISETFVQSFQFHRSHVRSPQLRALNLSRSLLPSNATDHTRGSGQPPVRSSGPTGQACFSATLWQECPFFRDFFRDRMSRGLSEYFFAVFRFIFNRAAIPFTGIPLRHITRMAGSCLKGGLTRGRFSSANLSFLAAFSARPSISLPLRSFRSI
jgi:hypothetical protein